MKLYGDQNRNDLTGELPGVLLGELVEETLDDEFVFIVNNMQPFVSEYIYLHIYARSNTIDTPINVMNKPVTCFKLILVLSQNIDIIIMKAGVVD